VVAQRDGHAGPPEGEEQTERLADLPRAPLDEEDTERLPPGFTGGRAAPRPGRSLVAEARSLIAAVGWASTGRRAGAGRRRERSARPVAGRVPRAARRGHDRADARGPPAGPTPDVEPVTVTDAHLPGLDALVVVGGGRGAAPPSVPTIVVAEPARGSTPTR
jgi:hypothetical protein